MTTRTNAYGQPIGEPMQGWTARQRPPRITLEGRYCRLEPLDARRHGDDLFAAYAAAPDGRAWTYLAPEPFTARSDFDAYLERNAASADPLHYTVVDAGTQRAVGTLSLMRMDTANGVIEVGHVVFSPLLQRSRASTEAQYLLMKLVFETLGYRRYEWKCDSLNAPSRSAAARLGFSFEGVFRQLLVYKNRTRDTAWFSIIDGEWPLLKKAFDSWLSPGNFDAGGAQVRTLVDIRDRLIYKTPAAMAA
jgi:RimJ/RimL family protein N-acetyltransferase